MISTLGRDPDLGQSYGFMVFVLYRFDFFMIVYMYIALSGVTLADFVVAVVVTVTGICFGVMDYDGIWVRLGLTFSNAVMNSEFCQYFCTGQIFDTNLNPLDGISVGK